MIHDLCTLHLLLSTMYSSLWCLGTILLDLPRRCMFHLNALSLAHMLFAMFLKLLHVGVVSAFGRISFHQRYTSSSKTITHECVHYNTTSYWQFHTSTLNFPRPTCYLVLTCSLIATTTTAYCPHSNSSYSSY